jgi:AraC family transcriptional regulator
LRASFEVPTFPQGLNAHVLRHSQVGGFHFNEYVQTDNLTWHRHEDFNLALILDGAGKSITPHDEVAYQEGQVVFESFDLPQKHECGMLRCLNIHFPTSIVADDGRVPATLQAIQRFEGGASVQLMRRIYAELTLGDSASTLAVHGLTLELVAELVRSGPGVGKTAPRWLRQVEDYVRAHFTGAVYLDSIADEVKLHPAHLSRAFRKSMGCTLGEFVRKLRVQRAVDLIASTELPLPNIAATAGFYDQADMTRSVKRLTGKTPAMHRRPGGPR